MTTFTQYAEDALMIGNTLQSGDIHYEIETDDAGPYVVLLGFLVREENDLAYCFIADCFIDRKAKDSLRDLVEDETGINRTKEEREL